MYVVECSIAKILACLESSLNVSTDDHYLENQSELEEPKQVVLFSNEPSTTRKRYSYWCHVLVE